MKPLFTNILSLLLPVMTGCLASYADTEQAAITTDLNGKTIQFSYSPAHKFTPLVILCGKSLPDNKNTYNVQSDERHYKVTYTPNTQKRTATIRIDSPRDSAEILLTFDNDVCGTAHMTWNRIKYYHLKFRIQNSDTVEGYLQRMGDPVGDVVPPDLMGKILTINFQGAIDREITQDAPNPPWQNSSATPFIIQFPADAPAFEVPSGMQDTPDDLWPPLKVTYEPIGTASYVNIDGRSCHIEIELDFADCNNGLAHVQWASEEGSGWVAQGATFSLCNHTSKKGDVTWPYFPESNTTDTVLLTLATKLAATQYSTAVEELYKRRLLSVLPAIAAGGDVNQIIPEANGTTALHNACGLSHTEIVQWLVNHGANLSATTAKGATVDDCIGGANAKAIRAIIRKARAAKNR